MQNYYKIKNKIVSIFLLLVILLMFTACSNTTNETETDRIYIENNVLCVELQGNYTTGYQWFYTLNNNIVNCINEEYVPNQHNENMVGVGGVYFASFSCVSDGTDTLTFVYKRSFEDSIAKKITVNITVINNQISFKLV